MKDVDGYDVAMFAGLGLLALGISFYDPRLTAVIIGVLLVIGGVTGGYLKGKKQ